MIMKMRDESNRERLITKERTLLVVLRKISSGKGLISNVGSDGSLGILMGSSGIIMTDYTMDGIRTGIVDRMGFIKIVGGGREEKFSLLAKMRCILE